MWDKVLMAISALSEASNIAGNLQDRGGGVGGATSAQTQGGQTGLQYQDVQGTGISPFEFKEVLAQLEDEDQQRQMAEAMALAQEQGLWSGGLISLMQGGPLYANEGMEIEEMIVTAPPIDTDVDLEIPELIEDVVVEEEQPTSTLTMEDIKADLDQMARQQRIRDTFEAVGELVTNIAEIRNPQKSTISPRRSVTPLPGKGGGRAARQERQRVATSGITPFTYQGVAGGGALGRSMFAQNYMPHGGAMRGPGGPKDDLIPVMASDGEYMLSKAAVDQAGGGNHAKGIARLEQFNRLGNRRYG
jgi:hypothetical protein